MCFSTDAHPPDHGVGGVIGSSEDLVLTASDGNRLAARLARPAQPAGTGVVILPDVRGLHNFYRDLACRFAEAGVDALAIDYFGRTDSTGDRGGDFDYRTHFAQTKPETVDLDAGAGLEHLQQPRRHPALHHRLLLRRRQLLAPVGLPGRAQRGDRLLRQAGARGRAGPGDEGSATAAGGGADSTPASPRSSGDLDRRLGDAGLAHRMVVYDGAPHSFFDRSHRQWQDASADAWKQILAFLKDPGAEGATV